MYRPYERPDLDLIYNLLFCDDPQLFQTSEQPAGPLAVVLSGDARPRELERLANDASVEARVRILAYNSLRNQGVAVPQRRLLGVVVEVPTGGGLDVLAVYLDGRMRYINYVGKLAVVEAETDDMRPRREQLMRAAGAAVERIGRWDDQRQPPSRNNVRLTFLVSDGLYFGEAPMSAMARDPIGGPVFAAAGELLQTIVAAAAAK